MLNFIILLTYIIFINSYTVTRNVLDYGAKGDGITDDTLAIINALTSFRSDNGSSYPHAIYSPSTLHPARIYFPDGIYIITQTLPLIYYTQMVGDFNNWPTIKFISNDNKIMNFAIDVAGSWYPDVSQNNFYRQIRNFNIDLTECANCAGVHWKVAQATILQNVYFNLGYNNPNIGIFMEEGSGGQVSDLVFEGGDVGMWIGNQQFTSRNITIRNAASYAVFLNFDWVWTFVGLVVENSPVGIQLEGMVGTLVVIDSSFSGITQSVINTNYTVATKISNNSIVLENISYLMDLADSTSYLVSNPDSNYVVVKAYSQSISYAQGHVFNADGSVSLVENKVNSDLPNRPSVLTASDGSYFQRMRPQFNPTTWLNISTLGIIGDGVTDVTAALQKVFLEQANGNTLYFPEGIYIISNTIYIPAGIEMVGEVWPVLMADGPAFQDSNNPIPMLMVGKPGEVGEVLMTDFILSTRGPQPGAVLMEWNMHEPIGNQGGCGIWSVHFRIGGAYGTNIDPDNCPSTDGTSSPASTCDGAFMLLHVTKYATIYMENVWGWVADHDIDLKSQINVYNGRGFLCESEGPVWMYGTAFEHSFY